MPLRFLKPMIVVSWGYLESIILSFRWSKKRSFMTEEVKDIFSSAKTAYLESIQKITVRLILIVENLP